MKQTIYLKKFPGRVLANVGKVSKMKDLIPQGSSVRNLYIGPAYTRPGGVRVSASWGCNLTRLKPLEYSYNIHRGAQERPPLGREPSISRSTRVKSCNLAWGMPAGELRISTHWRKIALAKATHLNCFSRFLYILLRLNLPRYFDNDGELSSSKYLFE